MTREKPKHSPHSDQAVPGQPEGRDSLTPDDLLLVPGPDLDSGNPAEAAAESEPLEETLARQGNRRVAARSRVAGGRDSAATVTELSRDLAEIEPQPFVTEALPTESEDARNDQAGCDVGTAFDLDDLQVQPTSPESVEDATGPLSGRLAGWRAGPQLPERLAEPVRRPLSESRLRDLPAVRLPTEGSSARWVPAVLSMSVVVGGVALATWVLDQWRDPVLAGLGVSASVTLAAFLWIWKRR